MKYFKLLLIALMISLFVVSCSTDDDGPTGNDPEPDITNLVINEFMASNDSAYADENGEFDDWIEIYNPSDFDLDLAGIYITDAISDTSMTTWQIPAGSTETIVAAGGYLVLWADKEPDQGVLHVNIKLSGSGEDIALTDVDGTTIIDQYTYAEQETDISFGRAPDGSDNWEAMVDFTPGAANVSGTPPVGGLVINEFMSHNDNAYAGEFDDYPDWIELYNAGNTAIDIGGWSLTDDLENLTQSVIPTTDPAMTTIQPGEYLVLDCDSQANPGILHLAFKLSDDEDFALVDPDGVIVDQQNTIVVPDDMSNGRVPDGSDTWEILDPATPGGPNN
ncbi:MAG: lamin tail domain-containing protein [Candidatus Cloacimonetes bacterium]|nr:lamin tail domain-containing protein [Candidatus Cloacimonadota bacterium]MBT4333923.1 lamin tail domain-containing protein [Candidatus Cloacimonadota bacterium]MBT5419766.1 lamin tail domain-containing protein [Candidatus Cloacimonadota bacterium]